MSKFIANLRLGQKLSLLGLVAILVVAILLTLQIKQAVTVLGTAKTEAAGIAPSRALLNAFRLLQQHRGVTGAALGRDPVARAALPTRQAEVTEAMQTVADALAHSVHNPAMLDTWQQATQTWQALAKDTEGLNINVGDSFDRHTALIDQLADLHDDVADHFGLTLDSQAADNFLVTATLRQMPRLTEVMGQLRAVGATTLVRGEVGTRDRLTLSSLRSRVEAEYSDMTQALNKAIQADPAIQQALSHIASQTDRQILDMLDMIQNEVLGAMVPELSASDYFDRLTQSVDAAYALTGQAHRLLQSRLDARVQSLYTREAILLGGVVLLIVFGLWLGLTITRSITRPAAIARDVAQRIAAGDLTMRVPTGSRDEMGQLLDAIGDMRTNLINMVREVRQASDAIVTGSSEIASGNLDLSQRTEEQAANLEETAASMEQLTATIKLNAETGEQARQLARQASNAASQGGEVVNQVVSTMRDISQSSQHIADIIAIIDSIAFQTNILALNAAVEAARAGEQGRGFAVVAGEVRSLAQNSANAAKEIKELITASVARVEAGSQLVGQAGEGMQSIVTQVHQVSTLIDGITTAGAEQSTGISQVSLAVQQLDQVTQQNAALVEQSAAAADSLRHQADRLREVVNMFRLSHSAQVLTTAPSPRQTAPSSLPSLPAPALAAS